MVVPEVDLQLSYTSIKSRELRSGLAIRILAQGQQVVYFNNNLTIVPMK